jgi:hypothetical protein
VVGSVAPRNEADRLLHRQGGTIFDDMFVEGKVAPMFVSSLVNYYDKDGIITQEKA